MKQKTIHWFRKGLRLHDNPSLLKACNNSSVVWPVFILDPWFVKTGRVGKNRWTFLLQALGDLDKSLRSLGGQLFILHGKPEDVFPDIFKKWEISHLTYEVDTEPYAVERDQKINNLCSKLGITTTTMISHTLYNADSIIAKNNAKVPGTYQKFLSVAGELGPPEKPTERLSSNHLIKCILTCAESADEYKVPTLDEYGIVFKGNNIVQETLLYSGGETEALARMEKYLKKTNWICNFEKPKTEPNSIQPSTTVLSPYLKFGCLSVRTFYWKVQEIYAKSKKHSQPPVSLHGQLMWREFFYAVGHGTDNFNQIEGNTLCRQIKWDTNPSYLSAWKNGRTGYPFIDAIMIQLQQEGWIHHLARHAVACFLTRGDLWISWEEGQQVFEELLLDADWFLNAGNWMWLSASAFFHQYFRVYSPVAFGKKTDKQGQYIKKYLPVLKKYPTEYIYEPWKAPLNVQKSTGCIIGVDYPKPIVDHDKMRVINIERMKSAYNKSVNVKDVDDTARKSSSQQKRKDMSEKQPSAAKSGKKRKM